MRKILVKAVEVDGKTVARGQLVKVWKKLTIKIFLPKDVPFKVKTTVLKAGPGKCFTAENIDAILMDTAERIDERFKMWDFKMVQIAPNEFNFVAVALKAPTSETPLGRALEPLPEGKQP